MRYNPLPKIESTFWRWKLPFQLLPLWLGLGCFIEKNNYQKSMFNCERNVCLSLFPWGCRHLTVVRKDIKLNLRALAHIPRDKREPQVSPAPCPSHQRPGLLRSGPGKGRRSIKATGHGPASLPFPRALRMCPNTFPPSLLYALHSECGSSPTRQPPWPLVGPGERTARFPMPHAFIHLPEFSALLSALCHASRPNAECRHRVILNADTCILTPGLASLTSVFPKSPSKQQTPSVLTKRHSESVLPLTDRLPTWRPVGFHGGPAR